jgi:hypothetical protein
MEAAKKEKRNGTLEHTKNKFDGDGKGFVLPMIIIM